MSENIKFAGRIPHESLTGAVSVRSWSLPTMDSRGRVIQAVKKKSAEKSNESIETLPKSKKPKPLTAEDMQKIAEQAKKEGYAEGYQEGKTKGHTEGLAKGEKQGCDKAYKETRRQIELERSRLKNISNQLMVPMGEQELILENIIIDTAIRFAQEIIQKEITQSPEVLFDVVVRAISALPAGANNISLTLNESDAELFNETYPEAARNWSVRIDNRIESGGCKVETAESLVDYSIQTRLDQYLNEVKAKGEKGEDLLKDVETYIHPDETVDVLPIDAAKEPFDEQSKGWIQRQGSEELDIEENTLTEGNSQKQRQTKPAQEEEVQPSMTSALSEERVNLSADNISADTRVDQDTPSSND